MKQLVDLPRKPIGKCGKVCFATKKDVVTNKNWKLKQGKEKYLREYHCNDCSAWHLTSKDLWE